LNENDIATLDSGCFSLLPINNKGQHVIVFESSKYRLDYNQKEASDSNNNNDYCCSFHSHQRVLFYLLDSLLSIPTTGQINNNIVQVVLLVFVNEASSRMEIQLSESFDNVWKVFFTADNSVSSSDEKSQDDQQQEDKQGTSLLELAGVHVFLEPVGLGWFSYQSNAENRVSKWFNLASDRIEYHTLQLFTIKDTLDTNTGTTLAVGDEHQQHKKSSKGKKVVGAGDDIAVDSVGKQDTCEAFSIVFGFDRINLPEWMGGGWTSDRSRIARMKLIDNEKHRCYNG
jgi:hypothetical protein